MAKSARSNAKKKLRTQRREQVEKQTAWIASADEKRQAALAACLASAPVEPHVLPTEDKGDTMETADKPTTVRVKKALKKPLKGAVMKKGKGGKKKVSVLAGKNQFHKKAKKGRR